MGFRNPFRFSVDPNTGWIGLADYAPDSGTDAPDTRGPAGIVEYNLIKAPGNYGWPLCMGDSEPFRDVDYKTSPVTVGPFFDCANPVNDSILNTGRTNLPPAQAPVMYYGYTKSSVPAVIPAGGGLAPMGGPFYDFDPALASDVKFPEYFDGKPFFFEWSKNRIYSMTLDDEGTKLEKISRFQPNESFLSPQDMKFGPDGALYTLEWGGGFGRDNPNSGIYRVDYINGSRSPIASATATPDNGQEPLTVTFDGSPRAIPRARRSATPGTSTATARSTRPRRPRPTPTRPPAPTARGSRSPTPPASPAPRCCRSRRATRGRRSASRARNGGFIDWGDSVAWDVDVTDADGAVEEGDVIVQPALGHDAPHPPDDRVPGHDRLRGHRPRRRPLGGHEGVLRARRPLHRRRRRGRRAAAHRLEHRDPPAQAQGGRARRRLLRHGHRRDRRRPRRRRRRRAARPGRRRLGGL